MLIVGALHYPNRTTWRDGYFIKDTFKLVGLVKGVTDRGFFFFVKLSLLASPLLYFLHRFFLQSF